MSLYNAGGLAEDVTQDIVQAAFIPFGDIAQVNMPMDPNNAGTYSWHDDADELPTYTTNCMVWYGVNIYAYRSTSGLCIRGIRR